MLSYPRRLASIFAFGLCLSFTAGVVAQEQPSAAKAKKAAATAAKAKGKVHRVPYVLTETKHVLVRIKINGKGPYNFIIDTGAPALFISTETAKKTGLKADNRGWGVVERFQIEGGPVLEKARGRIEDPFQLTGMNRMNIAGHRLDGILGYTVLARYRIEFDFTRPHLVWTELDWEPPWPKALEQMGGGKPPAEVTAMGGLVNIATALVGRRPDAEILTRGFLGVELIEESGKVRVWRVLPNTPAAEAGLKKGDQLLSFQKKPFKTLLELQKLAADVSAGQDVQLELQRGVEKQTVTIKTGKAL